LWQTQQSTLSTIKYVSLEGILESNKKENFHVFFLPFMSSSNTLVS
jgi:hypothetical protein